jgi:prepilin-type N-terminal cleavage/methylation domain-containing protein
MKQAHGFTLIELAIVLVIITILIGGLAMPLSAQIQARRIAETRKTMEEAREAIIGYAMTHPADTVGNRYLPCPDTDGDGRENRDPVTKRCGAPNGLSLLPWVDLGTAQQDAWGNRLRYAVIPVFADGINGFSASSPLNMPLEICSASTCAIPDVAEDIVFVLVSHGSNGWGARNINGNTLANPTGANELENLDVDGRYISRGPSKADDALGEFDDLTTWVSHNQLIGRVCPTGSDCNPLPAP